MRSTLRWTSVGRTRWHTPQITPTQTPAPPQPIRIAVATGSVYSQGPFKTLQNNIDFYLSLSEAACQQDTDLLVLPEVALQWRRQGNPLDQAIAAPGPATEPFAELARRRQVRILLGLFERNGDTVYNSAVLINPQGQIDGRYDKVHLAVGGESESGILPGDGFPVFNTELGRIGCNICMDSSAAESARMVGLGGADLLLLPIMGDHRASRWNPGTPNFNESRWKAIMRTRAMDNQLEVVAVGLLGEVGCIGLVRGQGREGRRGAGVSERP